MLIGLEQRDVKVGVCSENLKKKKKQNSDSGCFLLLSGEDCIRNLEMSGLLKAILSFFNVTDEFFSPLIVWPRIHVRGAILFEFIF